MKKILTLLCLIGLIASTNLTIIACGNKPNSKLNNNKNDDYDFKIKSNKNNSEKDTKTKPKTTSKILIKPEIKPKLDVKPITRSKSDKRLKIIPTPITESELIAILEECPQYPPVSKKTHTSSVGKKTHTSSVRKKIYSWLFNRRFYTSWMIKVSGSV
ncbi:hypothetical protein [Mycoplasma mycoides]|uniref:hypothetical protein n=1 Tax=Mycoplasma mycoides TaxID=2102 RepID=UPI0027354F68|nr:hypothetical protein [Mycoplasma mycoides]MDP4040686.1 hypothetical protein [Mycoplasma mycoides]MDP4041579.1 hypothetical protein [Mycoplasma mycoides]MDP4042447.1 hypothetical protein [Mycoplasma mycoides]MDP4043921.1 hypothetical protein [Mycoplasma mycoides]MDP4044827.1 hypothetical protein [Mycoplasma mycoides]